MGYIDKALDHTPTLIEAYMVKARIYKVWLSILKKSFANDLHISFGIVYAFDLNLHALTYCSAKVTPFHLFVMI